MFELGLVLLAVAIMAVVAYAVLRPRVRSTTSPAVAARPPFGNEVEVTLPVDDADPLSPATRRLVSDAASRAFARDTGISCVVVQSRSGRELGRIERAAPEPRPFVDTPTALHERHGPRPGPREPVGPPQVVHAPANVRFREARTLPHLPLAAHFELPDRVKELVRNDEDPVDIVRAIVEVSGVTTDVSRNMFRRGDRVMVVLHTPLHVSVEADVLNAAYVAFQRTGAARGVVVTAGVLHVLDVRRREAFAPHFLHIGPDGIQHMADAVAVGADPFDFAVLPA